LAVRIRLKRMGRKKRPFYRIVVADSRAPRDGKTLESLGYYNPLPDPPQIKINEERLFHWLGQGAQVTDTVRSLMRREGLTLKYELLKRGADEATINRELQKRELLRQKGIKHVPAEEAASTEAADEPEETASSAPEETAPEAPKKEAPESAEDEN